MLRLFNRRASGAGRAATRVLVIGLDCAAPELVFEQFRTDLPNLSRLMAEGSYGVLESSIPCITVPAWACMTTSRDPGVLGVYGFRNRPDPRSPHMQLATGADVRQPRVWDVLSEAGRTSVVLSVPQTFPPRPLRGHMASGFPVNGPDAAFAYPAIFRQELLNAAPDFAFDVPDFRTEDKAGLLARLYAFTEAQYQAAEYAITHKPWDFFMHVNLGVDRMHHGFWRYHDPTHRLYTPGNPFAGAIRDYYRRMDAHIGRLLALAGDDVLTLVVSDHGVRRMDGGICLNEWLWREGWLHFRTPPPAGQITRFNPDHIDWSRTRAWGEGGYYGRVWLNLAGREAEGIVPTGDYAATRDALAEAIAAIPGPDGAPLATQVYRPDTIYAQVNGIAPDLLVYFGDLHWRSVGSLGHEGYYTLENDTGPDDANHAPDGLYILHDPRGRGGGLSPRRHLMDIAPTILRALGVAIPPDMQGTSLLE